MEKEFILIIAHGSLISSNAPSVKSNTTSFVKVMAAADAMETPSR
jgi:hypothetical protein